MSSVPNAAAAKARERVEWLDLFRGAAVLAMVETHVVNTFLAPALREAAWFGWLNWFNGLIAPAFLFIAGYAQGMSWRAIPGKSVAFARKARRLMGIAALGYALHFPWTELGQQRWADAWRSGTQVDVLQCLSVALLAVLGVQMAVRAFSENRRRAAGLAAVACMGICTVALAPYSPAWSVGMMPLDAFVNARTGSLFPVFPWAAFVFCGVLAGAFASRKPGWMLVVAGLLKGGAHLAGDGVFSSLSATFFSERLAWVLALAALCQWIAHAWRPRGVLFAGRESLVMYAGHLVLIEWTVQAGVPRGGFGLGGAVLLIAGVLAVTFAVAFAKAKWSARTARKTA